MCDSPFLPPHVGLPSCCPCQGTVGSNATMDSPEPGPFGQGVQMVRKASLDSDCPNSDRQLHHFLCVTLDRLLMSLCFRFLAYRMGITLYGPQGSEALQVQSSAQCLTVFTQKHELPFPVSRPHCYQSPASPPPPARGSYTPRGLNCEWSSGGWPWPCLPPHQQLRTMPVLHRAAESPGK